MNFIILFLKETWYLTAQMAPYLLLGFFFAGILYVFLPSSLISRHLGKENFFSVLKASVFGIPLPLCSCGVLPVATSVRQSGAGRAPTLSFLITTPVTGVDSILATYGLMGWIFTIARVVVSFIIGILAGALAIFLPGKAPEPEPEHCSSCEVNLPALGFKDKMKKMFFYGFYELPETLSGSVLLGLVIGGIITVLIPANLVSEYLGTGMLGIVVAILVAIPLYVCATGSIPIALAMMLKGFSPGAALAFLIAGPATNAVAVTTVRKILGTPALLLYLVVIFAGALGFGKAFDAIIPAGYNLGISLMSPEKAGIGLIYYLSGILLLGLLLLPKFRNWGKKILLFAGRQAMQESTPKRLVLKVEDMTCNHCKEAITRYLLAQSEIKKVEVDLKTKLVTIFSDQKLDAQKLIGLLQNIGYHPQAIE